MREAAKRIGIPETTYREWEYGRSVRGELYPRIAKAFGIGLEELFGLAPGGARSIEERFDQIISDLKALKERLGKRE